ncbi:MAG: HAD-IA family hydrolase [Gammaproteobacteria bacterium]|nr:HAD-IA family hydrolase [Gammaproteobacteria bacterium]
MRFKVLIFDWDGTLVDSVAHIAGSLRLAAAELGFPDRPEAALRDIIGLGMVEALQRLYPGIDQKAMEALRKAYARHFFARETTPSQVFDGVTRLLEQAAVQGCRLAVATGKSRHGLDLALASTGLGRYFELTRCADETASKPDPQMLREIIGVLGVSPAEAVMIGDTTYDMDMAQRMAMPGIGVSWGVHDEQAMRVHQPLAVVDSLGRLAAELELAG